MKLKALVVGIVVAVATPLAMAEGSGYYIALDLGQSKFKEQCTGFVGSCSDTDTAFRAALGYQINQSVGVEGAYVNAGQATASAPGFSGSAKLTDWQLAVVGTLPVGSGFSLIGKAGLDFWSSKFSTTTISPSGNGSSLLLGIGGQYDINKSVAIRGQYEIHEAGNISTLEGIGKVSMLSMGVVYKF